MAMLIQGRRARDLLLVCVVLCGIEVAVAGRDGLPLLPLNVPCAADVRAIAAAAAAPPLPAPWELLRSTKPSATAAKPAAAPAPAAKAAAAKAPGSGRTIAGALKAAGLTDCLRLVEAAGAGPRAADPKTNATVLCPTNAAIAAFLKEMGLTFADLTRRPDLLDKLVAYHVVPRARAPAAQLAGQPGQSGRGGGGGSYAVSGDPHYLLRFSRDPKRPGSVTVRDAQGAVSRVVKADVDAGRSVVHAVDRVLGSGEYFPSLRAFGRFYMGNFSGLRAALNASGLAGLAGSNKWEGTLFAPVNGAYAAAAALAPALGRLKKGGAGAGGAAAGAVTTAEAEKLKRIVAYAQLPEVRVYPGGFTSGKSMPTRLKGHSLSVDYARRAVTEKNGTATVLEGRAVPEAGSPSAPAAIGLPNVWVARGVVHGVDGVLLPAAAPATAAAAASVRAPAGRRLLRGGGGGDRGGFRGAGDVRPDGGGFAGGGGGRAMDYRPADLRPADNGARRFDDRTVTDTTNNVYDTGANRAGYTDAALAGAALGAAEGEAYNNNGDYENNQGYQNQAAPQGDYEDTTATAPPSDAPSVPGIVAPPVPPPPPPAAGAAPSTCINCCVDCTYAPPQPQSAPVPPPPVISPPDDYADEDGRA